MAATGYGDQHPVAEGDDEASFARNRRVQIVVVPSGPGPDGTTSTAVSTVDVVAVALHTVHRVGRRVSVARTVDRVSDPQQPDRQWESFDLRRPTKLSREQLRAFDLFHDTFSRRLSNSVGRLARAAATVDIVRMSQLTWEEYQRTLPAVTTLVTAMAPPLPGELLVEMDTSLSLALAGRLLGGSGRMEAPRHPSELELPALQRIGSR